ncbi:MAG: TRAP transporter small permease subunit [Rhodobacteraceae bacterium]|nr:TRAP transporter small permease subunit [Paracoccaceae bacterium]
MHRLRDWLALGVRIIAATLLAAMFVTFLLQIYSRYVLVMPFGWTLELCLILWVWIVFFGCAFLVREQDHVSFDIFYLAAPARVRQILALISSAAIVIGMAWMFLPTWDYIDWMGIRKTTTVRNPFTGEKIPMRTIFSIYAVFMLAVIARYGWRCVHILIHNAPPDPPDAHNPQTSASSAGGR